MPVETQSNWYKSVNTSKTTHERDSGWQTIGELGVSVGIDTDNVIHVWLTKVLSSLYLSTEFVERFSKSVLASVTRAFGTNGMVPFVNVHISILTPHIYNSVGKSWGFFQIERIENQGETVDTRDHAIDFYLYVEGQ